MIPNWDPATEKAIVRKIDLRIFPVMIVLFILNFIDRNNFANARLSGLEKDLKLTDVQYQTCISVLLSGYVAMQIPSNMILNKLKRPSWYLCGCVAVWGVISAATGALRVTILNSGNLAAQGFGGLIAAGILADMEGAAGLRAWRWLFIVEGAVTVALAGVALFILPDYPKTTSWLTEEERRVAQDRLALDEGLAGGSAEDEDVTAIQGLIMACKDVKVWLLGLAYHATIIGLSNKKLDREEAMQDSVEAGAKDFVGYDGMTEVKSFRYLY
ncbi:hypothetical protein COL154_004038 [Colletotrichum chrysophilum]|nr:hypothetical protein COL154_004038 [Colletotrichum chrysophilum]